VIHAVAAAAVPHVRGPALRLALVAFCVLALNVPFGFWRAGLRRFSAAWFVAVHAPVPLVVGLRLLAGLRWHPASLLVLGAAYLAGQFCGGRLRARRVLLLAAVLACLPGLAADDPAPVPAPWSEGCASVAGTIEEVFGFRPEIREGTFPFWHDERRGCRLAFSKPTAELGEGASPDEALREKLTARGWQGDPRHSADGPGTTVFGLRSRRARRPGSTTTASSGSATPTSSRPPAQRRTSRPTSRSSGAGAAPSR